MNMNTNKLFFTDSYKLGHGSMLLEGTEYVYSYGEARKGAFYDFTLLFGLQVIAKNVLSKRVTQEEVDELREMTENHVGSADLMVAIEGFQLIVDELDGKIPLEIKAVPEGTKVPVGNVLFTIVNTDPRFAYLTNYFESLLMHVWSGSTVATRSNVIVSNIKRMMDKTSDIPELWKFMLHDFSFRGVSSNETAAVCGAGHLINGFGTDTVPALKLVKDFYDCDYSRSGFSVMATEHSISSLYLDEAEYVKTILTRFPDGIRSLVSDTNGIKNFIEKVVPTIKDFILDNCKNGKAEVNKVVFRPDSPRFKGDTPHDQVLWLCESLGKTFGVSKNSKGYKTLNPSIGIIYGDGINEDDIAKIYSFLEENGWSAENCLVGCGGGLAQKVNRDTQRFAIKCSSARVNGVWQKVQKNPSDVTKKSKAGKMKLVKDLVLSNDEECFEFRTVTEDMPEYEGATDELVTIFRDGEMIKEYSFDEVRRNAGLLV